MPSSRRALAILAVAAFVLTALLALGGWFCWPAPVNVKLTVERFSRYDDLAGHRPLGARVRLANESQSTVWYRSSVVGMVELVDGRSRSSASSVEPVRWTPLPALSSTIVESGPLSGEIESVRICVPVTADRISVYFGGLLSGIANAFDLPSISRRESESIHWVYTKELKPGRDYYPDEENGSNPLSSPQ